MGNQLSEITERIRKKKKGEKIIFIPRPNLKDFEETYQVLLDMNKKACLKLKILIEIDFRSGKKPAPLEIKTDYEIHFDNSETAATFFERASSKGITFNSIH